MTEVASYCATEQVALESANVGDFGLRSEKRRYSSIREDQEEKSIVQI